MNYVIISGSNRKESQSRKVSEYVKQSISKEHTSIIIDLYKENIEMWTEDIWNPESEQSKKWNPFSTLLKECDAVVIVAPEWAGSIPSALRNFLLHISAQDVAHKPSLIISVSSGVGGSNPITELRSHSVKNNHMIYIPDHVIVRHVNDVLNDIPLDELNANDFFIKGKIIRSLGILNLYAKYLKNLREEAQFDLKKYPYGM
jgi:NAD(P)H-dependent FMN reductase